MGKRSAVVELFLGDMGSIQRETRPSIQREDQLTMETKLEQIAVKARCEPKLRFTSLAHHITRDRVLKNLSQIPKRSAAGVDGQTMEEAVSYTHLRAHETDSYLVCRLLLEK